MAGFLFSRPAAATEFSMSFLRSGDRWVFVGDSITHNDLYRRKIERVYNHFHPEAPVAFVQAGVSGVTSEHRWADGISKDATMVSIMLGMNNYINSPLTYGQDPTRFLDGYRKDIETQVKGFRDQGAMVLLLSPTQIDPRLDHLVYELRGGEGFLRACAEILHDIAAKDDGVYYVPVQEEFDAFDRTLQNKKIDLACVPVLHSRDGEIGGRIVAKDAGPVGRDMGTWKARREGKGLLFSGEVFDDSLSGGDEFWPWARDGVAVWLDLRPPECFAGIGIDEDVHMTLLNVVDNPVFGATLVPWLGRGMALAAESGAERTSKGYKWHLFLRHFFTNKSPVDFSGSDFIGLNLVITDRDLEVNGTTGMVHAAAHEPQDGAIDKHPNALMLMDWNNRISGDQAIHLALFGR